MSSIDILEVQDDMDDAAYREIFMGAWDGKTLRGVVDALGSRFSTAAWSKVARGKLRLNHDMKNELRAYAGLPDVPVVSVPEGVRRVVRIGDEAEVVAIFPDRRLTFRMDGQTASISFPATRVARPRSHVCMRNDTFIAANEKRIEIGASWDEFMLLAVSVLGEVGA